MQLSYGTYRHADNECTVEVQRESQYDKRGRKYAVKESWHITGYLQAADLPATVAAVAALERAYSPDSQDLVLRDTATGTICMQRKSSTCWGGLHVKQPPSYPKGSGAEFAGFRQYGIVLEGMVLAGRDPQILANSGAAGTQILQWEEKLTLSGGGPRFVIRQTLAGAPIKQTVAQQTPYRATQSGHAVGRSGYPVPPPPLFPTDEHTDQRKIERSSPKRKSGDLYEYGVTWDYMFESLNLLTGLPTPDPG